MSDSDDLTANVPLMTALGRLVVRASELDADVADVLVRLCDGKTKKLLKDRSLSWKLRALRSVADQAKQVDELFPQISEFCDTCLSQLKDRNSPVHSTYLFVEDVGIVKWDRRRGPEVVAPEDIEKAAAELKRFANRAVVYNQKIRNLRKLGVLKGEYVPFVPATA